MKKLFAFLLAVLIVLGTRLIMKKQSTQSTTASHTIKNIFGIKNEVPTSPISGTTTGTQADPVEEIYIQPEPTPLPSPAEATGDAMPTVPSLEAQGVATGTEQVPSTGAIIDDGLTPLQRALKARQTQ